MSGKLLFGGVIALILLGLYGFLIAEAMATVVCTPQPDCLGSFNDRMASALSLIAGLIGALVISELAVSKPGTAPGTRSLDSQAGPRLRIGVKVVTTVYLAVWVIGGLSALVISWYYPDRLPVLTNLGESWFGLAIAAAYSYFGIRA